MGVGTALRFHGCPASSCAARCNTNVHAPSIICSLFRLRRRCLCFFGGLLSNVDLIFFNRSRWSFWHLSTYRLYVILFDLGRARRSRYMVHAGHFREAAHAQQHSNPGRDRRRPQRPATRRSFYLQHRAHRKKVADGGTLAVAADDEAPDNSNPTDRKRSTATAALSPLPCQSRALRDGKGQKDRIY